MRLTNFTFDTSVELGVAARHRYLDLHNCFDWQSITYLSEERRITMSWIRSTGDWVRPDLPPALALEFRGVSRFTACPRDTDLSYNEDSCLASVTFSPPDFATNFVGVFEGYRGDSEHITFLFQSGFGMKIWAEEVELIYDRST